MAEVVSWPNADSHGLGELAGSYGCSAVRERHSGRRDAHLCWVRCWVRHTRRRRCRCLCRRAVRLSGLGRRRQPCRRWHGSRLRRWRSSFRAFVFARWCRLNRSIALARHCPRGRRQGRHRAWLRCRLSLAGASSCGGGGRGQWADALRRSCCPRRYPGWFGRVDRALGVDPNRSHAFRKSDDQNKTNRVEGLQA